MLLRPWCSLALQSLRWPWDALDPERLPRTKRRGQRISLSCRAEIFWETLQCYLYNNVQVLALFGGRALLATGLTLICHPRSFVPRRSRRWLCHFAGTTRPEEVLRPIGALKNLYLPEGNKNVVNLELSSDSWIWWYPCTASSVAK